MSQRSIFISYRREDSEGQAGRLYEGLAAHFGEDRVFMDVAAIRAGRDFRREIEERVASCAVLLVLIGRQWLEARDAAGQRRLDDPADFVRLETGAALAKPQITVVPVLVSGARMPEAKDLPPDLKDMVFRNAAPLSHQRWDGDLEALIADIEDIMNPPEDPAKAKAQGPVARAGKRRRGPGQGAAPWLRWTAVGLGLTLVLALGLFGFNLVQSQRQLADFRAQAQAASEAASAAEAAVQAAKAKEEAALADVAAAAAAAASAQRALVEAEAQAQAASQASAAEQARAEAAAAELRAAEDRARREAEAKTAAAEATRLAAEQAREAASQQTQRSVEARQRLQRAGGEPAGGAAAAGRLDIPNWTLRAGCGGAAIAINGTASFRIVPQGNGVLVEQRFSGSGGGYTAEFAGQQAFDSPQTSYEVTARGKLSGERSFGAAWTVRVEAPAGTAPASARGVRFRSEC